MWTMLGSLVIGILGFYFLAKGKKTQDTNKMILGGLLIVASYWAF